MGEAPPLMGSVASWERRVPDDKHGGGKDLDEESTANFGEGSGTDGAKPRKAKCTLRK